MQSEETKVAVLENKIQNLITVVEGVQTDIKEIKNKLDDKYVSKEDFQKLYDDHLYWRNVLVSGILISIFTTIVLKYFNL